MNSEPNKSILIFLLTSIGLIAFPHGKNIPIPLFAFFYLLLSWRFIGIWKQNWLPNKLTIFVLTVCGLVLIYSQHHGFLGRDAGTRLFVTALGLKLLEIKSERELYLITYLAFIVAASQFLYEQSLLMAAYILFVCCVLLATLVCINSSKPQPFAALKTAGIILLQAIPMAVVLFILFPRIDPPKWMFFNEQHQAKAGLSDSMEPGSISDLGMSDELVFRVKFTTALPPPSQRYWRGPVLSYTDGKKWTQIKDLRFKPFLDKPVFTGSPYQYTLLMEPQNKNWVFALEMPADYALPLSQNANYQLLTSESPDKRTEYKITSYLNYNTGFITRTEYKDTTQLPSPPSAKIKQLVKQLHGFDSTPDDFIKQLLTHFRQEDFHYTLTPPLMEENPIETFLFETRYGFCSHYAAAFVYLMRVANIPARVVTGYQGGEWNKVGNFLEIRQADAHAWAEVWLENKGWVRFDPTAAIAPERIERNINIDQLMPGGIISFAPTGAAAQTAFNWLKQTRQLWSNIDYNWQRWVINYDNKNQSSFLSSLGITDIKAMMYWMIGSIGLLTTLLSWLLLYQKQPAIDPVLRIYNRFCKKLAKRGLTKGQAEGAKDFAERIKITLPEQAASIDQVTHLFIKLRYGKNAGLDDFKRFKQSVEKFKISPMKK
jgi:transglutaminase-like putative cysteine protease